MQIIDSATGIVDTTLDATSDLLGTASDAAAGLATNAAAAVPFGSRSRRGRGIGAASALIAMAVAAYLFLSRSRRASAEEHVDSVRVADHVAPPEPLRAAG